MTGPEIFEPVVLDGSVVIVLRVGFIERPFTEDHTEKHHSKCEDIGRLSVKRHLVDNLGALVSLGSHEETRFPKGLDAFDESKIRDFGIVIGIDQNVFKLHIQVAHRVVEMKLVKSHDNLLEEVASGVLAESPSICQNFEEITVLGDLHDHVVKPLLRLSVGMEESIIS